MEDNLFTTLENAAYALAEEQWSDEGEASAEFALKQLGMEKGCFTAACAMRTLQELEYQRRIDLLMKDKGLPLYKYAPLSDSKLIPSPDGTWVKVEELKLKLSENSREPTRGDKRLPVIAHTANKEPQSAPVAKLDAPATPATSNWKLLIQAEATRYWNELLKQGCSPTRNNILQDITRWCRTNKVVTDGGIYPASTYIEKHVLKRAVWKSPSD